MEENMNAMPGIKPRRPLLPMTKPVLAEEEIYLLVNAIHYFLDFVLIVKEPAGYRLVVTREKKVLTDLRFQNLRGARIAFVKLYKKRGCTSETKAQWSHAYSPEAKWLEQRLGPASGY